MQSRRRLSSLRGWKPTAASTVAAAILAAFAASAAEPEPPVTVLKCGHVLDVRAGTLLANRHIVVAGNRIAAMGPASAVAIPSGANVVDLTGAFVLPGLFDVHTHLMDTEDDTADIAYGLKKSAAEMTIQGIANARATLEAGFTSVRDVGPRRAFVDVALRNAIARGELPGPRMQAAGAYVTISGGAGDVTGLAADIELPRELRFGVADGPDQVRQRVRELIRHGADVIKVLATGAVLTLGSQPGAQEFTYEELRAAVDEAEKAGLRVACHAHGAAGAKYAIRAGVASIEHGSLLDNETLELMKQHGTFYVPTTYIHEAIMAGAGRGYPPEYIEKERVAGESEVKVFQRAVELSVRIAFGTDAAIFPHGKNARQFATYVEHGMPPLEAIRSATLNAAELMGWSDRLGSLEPGKLADVIAVRANPLEDVQTLETVVFVMKDGVVFRNDKP